MPSILELLPSFRQGGSERQGVQLTRLLHAEGCKVHLAVLDPEGELRADAERIGLGPIPSFPLTGFYNKNMAVQLGRFTKFLHERQITIVHTHDFYTNIFGMIGSMLGRVPVRIASRRESAVRASKQRLVERFAYRFAHAVVANCEEVRRQLIEEGVPNEKTITIYNGLDLDRLSLPATFNKSTALSDLNLPAGNRYVTILANLRIDLKDHPTFLRAAKIVLAAVPDARFILAGEGDLVGSLQNLAHQLGVGSATHFIGRCDRVAELLAVSDVCVLSSKAEGFSNAILEYMAAGRPVVATDAGGVREAVSEGETGYIVPVGDYGALADRIIFLFQNPEKANEMGQRGLRKISEKFSARAQLDQTLNLYERLLSKTGSTSTRPAEILAKASGDGSLR